MNNITQNAQPLNINTLEFHLSSLKNRYSNAQGQRDLLEKQKADKESELISAKSDIDLWRQVQILLSKSSEFARSQLKTRIEQTVTAALAAIFSDSTMKFEIEISSLGGKPAAEWRVVSSYGEIGSADHVNISASPEDAKGGGVTDVVSLALRLALLELSRPKPGGPVLFDEPGKMISKEYLASVADFLKQYAANTGRQIIMVTHHEVLNDVADVGYFVKQVNGVSEVARNV